jgi:hypothetical protein
MAAIPDDCRRTGYAEAQALLTSWQPCVEPAGYATSAGYSQAVAEVESAAYIGAGWAAPGKCTQTGNCSSSGDCDILPGIDIGVLTCICMHAGRPERASALKRATLRSLFCATNPCVADEEAALPCVAACFGPPASTEPGLCMLLYPQHAQTRLRL